MATPCSAIAPTHFRPFFGLAGSRIRRCTCLRLRTDQQAVPLGRGGVVEPRAPSCDDDDNYRAGQQVLEGRYAWVEEGIIDPSGEGPMIGEQPEAVEVAKS